MSGMLPFDFSCMATIEVGIMYDQIVKGTIKKTHKVDRDAQDLNTTQCTYTCQANA